MTGFPSPYDYKWNEKRKYTEKSLRNINSWPRNEYFVCKTGSMKFLWQPIFFNHGHKSIILTESAFGTKEIKHEAV